MVQAGESWVGCTFLEAVVVFRLVLAEDEREALLSAADQLAVELGYAEGEEISDGRSRLGAPQAMAGMLEPEDELLVSRMRQALAKLAAAAGEGHSENAVGATLDGIEMVLRGELLAGHAGELAALLPGFVFMVGLAVVEQDAALELSKRTGELIEEALRS